VKSIIVPNKLKIFRYMHNVQSCIYFQSFAYFKIVWMFKNHFQAIKLLVIHLYSPRMKLYLLTCDNNQYSNDNEEKMTND